MLGLATVILISFVSLSASTFVQDYPVVDKFIAAQAKREHGEEPAGIRKMVTGDLNHDGLPDLAVLYTIEGQNGSNNYIQYLAVFVQTKNGFVHASHRSVGGKNWREIEIKSVSDGLINLDTTDYGEKDPSCCPTIKGSTRFILAGRVLREKKKTKS
ncbi:MAG TPA: hypothetical protein VLB68_08525 [Pyrinomonadaceae bacterium]|nr:hypothetical protein [Pyrinomonadaceae bacterium]